MKIYDVEMQYLTVSYSTEVGIDRNGKVAVYGSDMVGPLSRVLLYCVVAPSFRYRVRRLVDPRKPVAISQFLSDAWSMGRGLGMPLRLEVKKKVLDTDQKFIGWIESQNIECVEATSIKSITAFERSCQNVKNCIKWGIRDSITLDFFAGVEGIDLANKGIDRFDAFCVNQELARNAGSINDHFGAWNNREKRFVESKAIPLDWDYRKFAASTKYQIPRRFSIPNPVWFSMDHLLTSSRP